MSCRKILTSSVCIVLAGIHSSWFDFFLFVNCMTALNHGTHQLDSGFSIWYYLKMVVSQIAWRSKWSVLFCDTDNLTLIFFLMLIKLSIQLSENNTKLLKGEKKNLNDVFCFHKDFLVDYHLWNTLIRKICSC